MVQRVIIVPKWAHLSLNNNIMRAIKRDTALAIRLHRYSPQQTLGITINILISRTVMVRMAVKVHNWAHLPINDYKLQSTERVTALTIRLCQLSLQQVSEILISTPTSQSIRAEMVIKVLNWNRPAINNNGMQAIKQVTALAYIRPRTSTLTESVLEERQHLSI
jgi:hypothetical protein